jgi:IS605 OrfB family transposase
MDRTVRLQILPTPDQATTLAETVSQSTAVFNAICAYGWEHHIKNGVTLHHRMYRALKAQYPALVSDLHIQVRVKAAETLKSVFTRLRRRVPASCPRSTACSPRYNHHTFAIDWQWQTVRLSTTAGRLTIPFRLPRYAAHYASAKPCTADLIRRPDGTFALHLVVDVSAPVVEPTHEVVGVDLGLGNPAVTSTNRFLGQRLWRAVEARYFRLRRALQRCRTTSATRHLHRLRGRQRRFRRNCDQSVTPGGVIALERLTGIRARVRQRKGRQNRRLHGWSFAQLKAFVAYKAEERGCTVAAVSPRHTSQRCSRCGHTARTNRRSRALFCCRACGYTLHADLNAARNIAAAYRAGSGNAGAGGLPVNQPDVAHPGLAGAAASRRL